MAEDIENGFKAAFVGAITGLVISAIILIIKTFNPMHASFASLFDLCNLVASILVITKLKYWGSGYLISYLVSMWLLSNIGLTESWLVLLYATVGIPTIILRFFGKLPDFLDNL